MYKARIVHTATTSEDWKSESLHYTTFSKADKALHTLYGGVVPEIASRKHIEKINQVIEQALADAHVTLEDITAIAVTYGPGLVGALLVGVSEAKAISFATGIPLVGVHHIEGHISANFIENKELEPPFICLVASSAEVIHSTRSCSSYADSQLQCILTLLSSVRIN